jgi:hypothetical protein
VGGSINIAIRFKDGRSVCVERWTNNTPWWFKNPKMFEGDEAYVQSYLDATKNNDYIAEPHSPGRPQKLGLNEYGLVVWDYMTGHHLDNNGYSSYTDFNPYEVEMKPDLVAPLADSGRLRFRRRQYERGVMGLVMGTEELTDVKSMAHAIEICNQKTTYKWGTSDNRREDNTFTDFVIVTDPLKVIKFDEGDWKAYKAKLIELEFPFSRKDGLNASLPNIPRSREITVQERYARNLFRDYKGGDDKQFDGVSFDKLDKFYKDQFMNHALDIMNYPDKKRDYDLKQLLGG